VSDADAILEKLTLVPSKPIRAATNIIREIVSDADAILAKLTNSYKITKEKEENDFYNKQYDELLQKMNDMEGDGIIIKKNMKDNNIRYTNDNLEPNQNINYKYDILTMKKNPVTPVVPTTNVGTNDKIKNTDAYVPIIEKLLPQQ
jgi:hypothetical protein